MSSIEALGLRKVYWDGARELEIFSGVEFSAQQGEAVAILGPSGSGKTTLLNLLSGLDTPTQGQVRLLGQSLSALNEAERARLRNRSVGFVFQMYHLMPEFTALENVMLPLLIGGLGQAAAREKAALELDRVGLAGRVSHYPSEMSGGERQRAAIARALANDPGVVFCDEPTGNLDRALGREIAELLSGLSRRQGRTLIVVTHDEHVAGLCDRVLELSGKLSERTMVIK